MTILNTALSILSSLFAKVSFLAWLLVFAILSCIFASVEHTSEDLSLIAEDFIIFGLMFTIFLYHLFIKNKNVLNFTRDIAFINSFIIISAFITTDNLSGSVLSADEDGICAIIAIFSLFINFLLYIDIISNDPKTHKIELPFLITLLSWVLIVSIKCFNFLFLFVMIESITLLVVIAAALYFAESGPKLIKPVIQFFILNLIISTFYLLGVGLFLFLSPYSNDYTLTYSAIYTWLNHVGQIWDVFESINMMLFVKLFCAFILLPILFKLTLAPFSIWIVKVYAELPWVVLLILMTIYKIVYITIFINLFIKVLNFVPSLQDFWVATTWLFIVPSIFVGCLAYRSQDLKTILAFTTVSQISYVIGALIVGDILAQKYATIYLILYCMQIFGFIAIFILLQNKYNFTNLNQMFLVKKYNKMYYYIIFSIIISLAGVPPFAGFFAKYFVFISIYNSGHFIIALAGLLSSFL